VCQCSMFAAKIMKLLIFLELSRLRFDIESSSSGAAAGAQRHRVTNFVMAQGRGAASRTANERLPKARGSFYPFNPFSGPTNFS
jgi:hypothetical protein